MADPAGRIIFEPHDCKPPALRTDNSPPITGTIWQCGVCGSSWQVEGLLWHRMTWLDARGRTRAQAVDDARDPIPLVE